MAYNQRGLVLPWPSPLLRSLQVCHWRWMWRASNCVISWLWTKQTRVFRSKQSMDWCGNTRCVSEGKQPGQPLHRSLHYFWKPPILGLLGKPLNTTNVCELALDYWQHLVTEKPFIVIVRMKIHNIFQHTWTCHNHVFVFDANSWIIIIVFLQTLIPSNELVFFLKLAFIHVAQLFNERPDQPTIWM